jgi:hypothetical protein
MKTLRASPEELERGLKLAAGMAYTVVVHVPGVDVVEMEDLHFHHDSAVVLPWRCGENESTTDASERLTGLAVIAAALRNAKDNPRCKLLLAGHADSSGGPKYNRKLSATRAEATRALLEGAKDDWAKACVKHQKVEDLQQALVWVAEVHGWPCHPGRVDKDLGPKTKAARRAFRKRYNEEFSGTLALDGETSASDWKAMFDLYEVALSDELGDDLSAGRAALAFDDPAILACGEDFATGAEKPEGMRSAADRRVDILFLDPEDTYPDFSSEDPPGKSIYGPDPSVQRRYLPVDPPGQIVLKLTAIEGLHKPGHIAEGEVEPKLAGYEAGYLGQDDKGRIFINHRPRTDPTQPWAEVVAKDTQYVELCAEVEVARGTLSPDVRVEWEWLDPNAPAHKELNEHGARLPDRVDVDNRPQPAGNRGTCDYPSPSGKDMARFAQSEGCGFSEGATIHLCTTSIESGQSRVRLHVSNVAGDNFVVRARLKYAPRMVPASQVQTGVMTVWKRIDVEYVRMENALALPIDKVPSFFEPARVQMDFAKERVIPSKAFLTELDKDEASACADLASVGKGEFKNEGKPGWFFLAAAERASSEFFQKPSTGATDPTGGRYTGKARVAAVKGASSNWEKVVVNEVIPGKVAIMKVRDRPDGPHGYMPVWKKEVVGGQTHLHLVGIDYQSDFEVPTGKDTGRMGDSGKGGAYDKTDMFYPRHRLRLPAGTWDSPGMGFGEDIYIETRPPGSVETTGLSPPVVHLGNEYFAGRLVVFTRAFAATTLNEDGAVATIVHEFTHAFGYPHKCGFYAWPQPPGETCTMNYFLTWLYGIGSRRLDRFKFGNKSAHLCAKHLAGVREVHLEDNPAIWSWKEESGG